MKKFLALIVILTMVLALIPMGLNTLTVTAMPDHDPRENPNIMWHTVRLEYGAFVRDGNPPEPPQGRMLIFSDSRPGGANREPFLRFEFGDILELYRTGQIYIQEFRLKMNLNEAVWHQPTGIYIMPERMAHFDYMTFVWADITRVNGGTSMFNNFQHLVGEITPRAAGALLSGNLWHNPNRPLMTGVSNFFDQYPEATGVTLRVSGLFRQPGAAAVFGATNHTIFSFTGMSRLPGEPILRIGFITYAMNLVEDAMEEFDFAEDLRNLSTNLSLPTSWHNGVAINWHSSDNSVIDSAGFITRPAFGESDRTATLTATFSHHDSIMGAPYSKTKTFDVTVLANRANPNHAAYTYPATVGGAPILISGQDVSVNVSGILANSNIDSAWLRLVPINGEFEVGANVTVNGVTRQLDHTGSVYIGDFLSAIRANGAATQIFTVTSTAAFHGAAASVTNDLRPAIVAPAISEALLETANYIMSGAIHYGDLNFVRSNLNLFTTWRYTPTISWASSHPEIIVPSGVLTRPENDTTVTLTATITAPATGESITRTITVIALGRSSDAAYFERLLSEITLRRAVETNNFRLPTSIYGTRLTVNWESTNTLVRDITQGAGGFANVTIIRPHNHHELVTFTAVIDDDGTRVEHNFFITLVRHTGDNRLFNRVVVHGDANMRNAVNENLDIPWIVGNNRTISIDTGSTQPFNEFFMVYEGVNTSGMRIYSSVDGNTWRHAYTVGAIVPNAPNRIVLPTMLFDRFVRFELPTGISAVNMIGGYADTIDVGGSALDEFIARIPRPPAFINGNFTLPTVVDNIPITWTSSRPSVVSVALGSAPNTADFTFSIPPFGSASGINTQASFMFEGQHQIVNYQSTHPVQGQPGNNGTGPSGPGGGGGGNWNRPGGGMDVGNISNVIPPPPIDQPVELPFNDITGHWASHQIVWLYSRGYVSGFGNGVFAPNNSMTREQMAQIIANAFELERTNGGNSPFADVAPGDWFYNAVSAMYDHGISLGDGTGNYGVGLNISRQDAVVLLYRMLVNMDALAGTAIVAAAFNDYAAIADYAREAVDAFRALEIVTGDPAGNFNPTDSITRAEMAIIIYRTLEFLR